MQSPKRITRLCRFRVRALRAAIEGGDRCRAGHRRADAQSIDTRAGGMIGLRKMKGGFHGNSNHVVSGIRVSIHYDLLKAWR